MSALWKLSALAMHGVVGGACQVLGLAAGDEAVAPVARFLLDRFINHGKRLTAALEAANDRAWDTLEYSLAGESLWERCTALFSRADDKGFREQVRAFLDHLPLPANGGESSEFRRQALAELRHARTEGFLRVSALDVRQLAHQAGRFASFADPLALLAAEKQALDEVAESFPGDRFARLRRLLQVGPGDGTPLLAAAARYFFRREVEEDRELFQGLAFVLLERQSESLEVGFRHLDALMSQHQERLRQMAGEVLLVATDTYREVQQISSKLDWLLERHRVAGRELRPDDSLLTISDEERRLVRDLVRRYRALPEEGRACRVELAFKVGAAEAITGDYAEATRDFATAADLAWDARMQAEAHASAFQSALSQRDHDSALKSLLAAARLDAERFAPFPLDKYKPERILGAGGFGAAFLCRHAFKRDSVVVKALWVTGLDRSIDEVFNEAQVLSGLNHPAVIQVIDCDFADRARRARPYVVMEYFDGPSLADYVEKHGPLSPEDFLPLTKQVAEGLHAAHERGIFHRDVKPANILVRKEDPQRRKDAKEERKEEKAGDQEQARPSAASSSCSAASFASWRLCERSSLTPKIIDFGLALRPATAASRAVTEQARRSLLGGSIAGTWKYAAPEQLGEAPGVPVAAWSDVYSFGRTCYFALLGTPEPDDDEKDTLPDGWKKLLSRCTARRADRRLASFAEVLQELHKLADPAAMPARPEPATPKPPDLPALVPLAPMRPVGVEVPVVRHLSSVAPLSGPSSGAAPKTPLLPNLAGQLRDGRRRPRRPAPTAPAPVEHRLQATELTALSGHTGTVSVVAFSPDGRTLVTGSFDDRLRLWSFPDGEPGPWLVGHTGDVNSAAISADGRLLATAGDDRTVRLWDLPSGKPRSGVLNHPDRVYSVAFSPLVSVAATGCDDFLVRLWSATGALHATLTGHSSFVRHVAFSADGKLLASASGDRTSRIWRVADGRLQTVLQGHANTVWCAGFSPDGWSLVTAGQDGTAKVWNVSDGRLRFTLEGHTDIVWCAAFSPDGRYLATASHDKTVRLWAMPDGRPLATLTGHMALVRYLAFHPDGQHLVTAGGDHTARVWLLQGVEPCDWSAGEPLLPPRPLVSITRAGDGIVYPGDELWLEVVVENAGRGDLVQLRADVESESLPLRRLSALFGRVKPGEKSSRCLSVCLPHDQPPGPLSGRLVFHEGNGYQPLPQEVSFTVKSFPREDLPVSWRLVDDGSGNSFGNGDGKPQRGECLDVVVSVGNETGQPLEGLSLSLVALEAPAGVVINIPRTSLPPLADGQCVEGRLTFSVRPTAGTGPVNLELRVEASDGRLFAALPVRTRIE
jgi:serine/threonine protein kinase